MLQRMRWIGPSIVACIAFIASALLAVLSLGVAIYDPARPEMPESLLARADAAMYRAKQQGKGAFVIAMAQERAP